MCEQVHALCDRAGDHVCGAVQFVYTTGTRTYVNVRTNLQRRATKTEADMAEQWLQDQSSATKSHLCAIPPGGTGGDPHEAADAKEAAEAKAVAASAGGMSAEDVRGCIEDAIDSHYNEALDRNGGDVAAAAEDTACMSMSAVVRRAIARSKATLPGVQLLARKDGKERKRWLETAARGCACGCLCEVCAMPVELCVCESCGGLGEVRGGLWRCV